MKKFITILGVSAAAVLFTTTANAQSATTITNSKGTATAKDLKSTQSTKEVTTSPNTATKATTTAAEKQQAELNAIKEYERKIEANRNNPRFDVKAAEEELARLKANAGVK